MKKIIKNILGGVGVGIANIIPGVSGGTMLVILGLFDKLMDSIAEIVKIKSNNRWEAIQFVFQVLVGVAIGLIGFAKVVDWLFINYSTQTFYWFIGLVVLSIPSLLKKELKGERISFTWLAIGVIIIFTIAYFAPDKQELSVTEFPELSIVYLLSLVFIGMISGGTMLFPGVSGSMVLLIIGQYYLFKSLVANVTTFQINVLVSLCFIGFGVVLGILISAKLTSHLLKTNRKNTVSLIVGLVLASAIILVPINVQYTPSLVISSFVAFAIGGALVYGIEKIA